MGENKPYYGDDWEDDETMDVLFSPFRDNRQVNPHSWDRKMKFWTEMIFDECRFSKSPIINLKTLPQRFMRKGKMPVCLEPVLRELFRLGKIQRVWDYRATANAGWMSWGVNLFVKKPLLLSFNTAKHMLGWQENMDGDFVMLDILKNQANDVLECHNNLVNQNKQSLTSDLIDMKALQEEMSTIVCGDGVALDLVVTQLVKDKHMVVNNVDAEGDTKFQVLRFQGEDKRPPNDITEIELQTFKLKNTSTRLMTQIEEIATEMERCRNDAKFYLSKGLKNSAKHALRRKKTLENLLNKRQSALDNIEGLLHRLNTAESDKMVLDAYADGTKAYKNLVASIGLTPEHIDNVMDDIQEVLDTQEEINESMSHCPSDTGLEMSMTDLDAELQQILDTAETQPDTQLLDQRLDHLTLSDKDLPSVPTFEPSSREPRSSPVRVPETSRHPNTSAVPTS